MSAGLNGTVLNDRRRLTDLGGSISEELRAKSIVILREAEINPVIPIKGTDTIIFLDIGGTNARVISVTRGKITSSTSHPLGEIRRRAIDAGHGDKNPLVQLGYGLALGVECSQRAHLGSVWSNNFKVILGGSPCICIGGSDKGEFFAKALADGVDVAALISEGFRLAGIDVQSFQAVNDTTALAGLHSRAVATFVGSTGANVCRVVRNPDGSITLYNLENGRKLLFPAAGLYQSDPEVGQAIDTVQIQQLCSGKWLPGVFLRRLQTVQPLIYSKLDISDTDVPRILSHILGHTARGSDILVKLDAHERKIVTHTARHIAARGGVIGATMIISALQADDYTPHQDGRDVVVVDSSQAEHLKPYKRALEFGIQRAFGGKLSLEFASRGDKELSPPARGLMSLLQS
jgi:hypothetical protein